MNSMMRAIRYITRKKTKSILLILIFLVAVCVVLGILSVLTASDALKKEILENTNTKVIIEGISSENLLSQDDNRIILELGNISYLNRVSRSIAVAGDFMLITGDMAEDNHQAAIIGYDHVDRDSPFEENVCRLTQGTFPQKQNEIVMNQNLASYNQLAIGDEIAFLSDTGEEIKAVITGLYLTGNEQRQSEIISTENRIENQVYATSDFAGQFNGGKFEKIIAYVENPEELSQTADEIDNLLGNKSEIRTLSAMYQRIQYSITQMERIAALFFWLTVVTGVLVVGMLLFMWVRSRKHEIAIFISLGISKKKVLFQMLMETYILYTVSVLVSMGIYGLFIPVLRNWINTTGGMQLQIAFSASLVEVVWCVGIAILTLLTIIALSPVFQKKIKEILSEMEE